MQDSGRLASFCRETQIGFVAVTGLGSEPWAGASVSGRIGHLGGHSVGDLVRQNGQQ